MSQALQFNFVHTFRARNGKPSREAIKATIDLGDKNAFAQHHVDAAVEFFVTAYLKDSIANSPSDSLPVEADISLEAAYAWSVATSDRKREVTNATLEAFANFYFNQAPHMLDDVSPAAAGAARDIIKNRLRTCAGNPVLSQKLLVRIDQFIEAADEEALESHGATIEWIRRNLETASKPSISADML